MAIEKLAVTVILYNPEDIGLEKVLENIKSYSSFILNSLNGKIYVIDNSPSYSEERANCFKLFQNCLYYHNKNNGGIAGAQNYACQKAIEDGYEWIMTMDQDSFFENDSIICYLKKCSDYSEKDKSVKSFTLRIHMSYRDVCSFSEIIRFKLLSPIKRKILRLDSSKMPKAGSEFYTGDAITFPNFFVPASANIINLKTWSELGCFDESLFLDQVDNDFTIRLIKKGYKVAKLNDVLLSHTVGDKKFTIFRKFQPNYNSFRLYYIFRNHFIMYNRYPDYQNEYKRLIREFFIDNCIHSFFFLKNLLIFFKAYKDYKKYKKCNTIVKS